LPDSGISIRQIAASELLARVPYFKLSPSRALLLGHQLGSSAEALQKQFPRAELLSVAASAESDLTPAARSGWWPRRQSRHGVLAQAAALPFGSGTFDLSYMNLLLPGCPAPDRALREAARVLRPGALLLFASLGPDSLPELAAPAGVYPDLPQLGELLLGCGFAEPVMDVERHEIRYASAELWRDELLQLATPAALTDRSEALTLTFELIVAAAFAVDPAASPAGGASGSSGEVGIPVSSVRRRAR
jgi:malonyl-CoA O-methyltransferase